MCTNIQHINHAHARVADIHEATMGTFCVYSTRRRKIKVPIAAFENALVCIVRQQCPVYSSPLTWLEASYPSRPSNVLDATLSVHASKFSPCVSPTCFHPPL
jgi:hypothetical protein